MSKALQATSHAPSSVPGRKTLLLSAFSSFFGLARRYPFLSSFAFTVALAGAVAGIVSWSHARDKQNPYQKIPLNGSGIALIGHSYQLDTTAQILSIEWEILGCGAYRLTTYPPSEGTLRTVGCDALDRAVDVYFNAVPEPVYSYDPANFPLILTGEPRYVYNLTIFDVDHGIDYFNPDKAPFDTYSLNLLVFVIEKATNVSMPIVTFTAGEAPNNFVISSVDLWTISNYTYDSGTGPTTIEVQSSVAYIEAKRSQIAQAFTTCLFIVNYALTIGSTYITLLVVFGKEGIKEAVLLLPVTIILTIPTLRGLYPDSPPFGIFIDTFGFFLQMMTVAMCSMVLVYYVVTGPKSVSSERQASRDDGRT